MSRRRSSARPRCSSSPHGLLPPPKVPFARVLLGGSLLVVLLSYLFYQPFDAWWYLRFLLPMWPVMMLLTAAALESMARRWLRPAYPVRDLR